MRKKRSNHQKQENEHGLPGWSIAMDTGSVNRFCAPAGIGVTLVEKREASITARDRCHVTAQSLDDIGHQRGPEWVCNPGGLESASSGTAGVVATVLGRTTGRARESGATRVGSARTG